MAEQNAMDYREHEKTYSGFIKLATWVPAAIAVLLLLMALFLA